MSKESIYWHKNHNVTVLIYHLVFPAKYRKVVLSDKVDAVIKETCIEIEKRYDVKFLEIGTDKDHVHFLVQSVPKSSVSELVRMIKSIIAKEVFRLAPEVKKQLWGGEFWSDGFFASTVGRHADEKVMQNYVKNQGNSDYKAVHKDYQLRLF
jgi:REP element-mobilizing transposase RayT